MILTIPTKKIIIIAQTDIITLETSAPCLYTYIQKVEANIFKRYCTSIRLLSNKYTLILFFITKKYIHILNLISTCIKRVYLILI